MSSRRPAPRRTGATVATPVVVVAAATLLAGCGASGAGLNPGVAARVGDATISADRADDVAEGYCEAIGTQLRSQGQLVPRRFLRSGVVGQLVMREAAEQLADQYGVGPGPAYQQRYNEIKRATEQLPADQRDAVLAVDPSSTYVQEVVLAVGRKLLTGAGQSAPADDAATKRGQRALTAWLAGQDVKINPEYGLEVVDGKLAQTDRGLSVAVGDDAKAADAATPDPNHVKGLPSSMRCG